jgi:hypothetical protein
VTLPRKTALIFGAVYALIGLVGFTVTGFSGTGTLIIFDLSVVHNVVHFVIGAAGLLAFATGSGASRKFGQLFGGVFGASAVLGLVVANLGGLLAIGGADVVLHAGSALVLLYAGFAETAGEERFPYG